LAAAAKGDIETQIILGAVVLTIFQVGHARHAAARVVTKHSNHLEENTGIHGGDEDHQQCNSGKLNDLVPIHLSSLSAPVGGGQ
jgi:hypothetical protein